ncbi:MAG: outer membrane beta-barrel protein [Bacteroidia bacterium]
MRNYLVSVFFLLNSVLVFAQSKSKWTYGFSANPTFSFTVNTTKSSDLIGSTNQTFTAYNDSVNKNKSYRVSYLNFSGWVNYSPDLKWTFQFGIGYQDIGFQINQNNIKFGDKLYPGVGSGKLEEKTSASRNISYDFRYHYLHLPLFANYHLFRSKDYRMNIYVSGGIALNVLLKHQITAKLDFDIDGKNRFNVDSSAYTSSFLSLNIAAMLGARVDYKIDKNFSLMVQPVFGACPFPISSGPISVYPFYFSMQAGIIYEIVN